jgi:hypothetical protein
MANLAITWKGQAEAVKAICLMGECVQRCQRVLGVNNPHFIASSSVLADWKAAEAVLAGQPQTWPRKDISYWP